VPKLENSNGITVLQIFHLAFKETSELNEVRTFDVGRTWKVGHFSP